jgi:hypothetical protein
MPLASFRFLGFRTVLPFSSVTALMLLTMWKIGQFG